MITSYIDIDIDIDIDIAKGTAGLHRIYPTTETVYYVLVYVRVYYVPVRVTE